MLDPGAYDICLDLQKASKAVSQVEKKVLIPCTSSLFLSMFRDGFEHLTFAAAALTFCPATRVGQVGQDKIVELSWRNLAP